jgi:hypothetical protein
MHFNNVAYKEILESYVAQVGERFVNIIQRVREDMPDLLVLGTNVREVPPT